MDGLIAGRIVHLVAKRGERQKCQPAMVAQVWEDEPKAYVNLVVTRDGSNDSKYDGLGYNAEGTYNNAEGSVLHRWATSVYEGQDNNQFHDPRACAVPTTANK